MPSPFIELDPRGKSPLEVGVRDLHRWNGFTARPCYRGLKSTRKVPLACTDGRFGYYNEVEINKRKPSEAAYIVGHENKHIIYCHPARFRPFNGARIFIPWLNPDQTWDACNVAGDLVINAELEDENEAAKLEMRRQGIIPFDIMTPIEGCFTNLKKLYDKDQEDISAEQLADKLLKLYPVPPASIGSNPPPQSGDGEGDPSNGDPSNGDPSNGDPSNGDPSNGDPSNGDPSDGDPDPSDDRAPAPAPDVKGDPATSGEFGGGHNDFIEPELDEGETLKEFDAANEESSRKAAFEDRLNETKGVLGSGSGSKVNRDLARTSDPVPWDNHLRNWFTNRDTTGFNRPFCHRTHYRRGLVRRARGSMAAAELAFAVDTSGSNIDRIPEMIVKIQEVLDEFNPKAVHVIPIDTRVHETTTVYAGEALPDFLGGGGGTRFAPAFEWVEENVPWVDGMVFLTDGHCTLKHWKALTAPDWPVLWLDYGYHKPSDIGTRKFHFGERVPITLGKKV